jgi:hypothetical protein
VQDYGDGSSIGGAFIALYNVHTRYLPTGSHSEAHTVERSAKKLYLARAHEFTNAIDKELRTPQIPHRIRFPLAWMASHAKGISSSDG